MAHPLLSANNLSKAYGRQQVIDHLSFVINEGAHIGLAGRNGAGKTTLLRLLSGMEEADSGTIEILPRCRLGVLNQHEILPDDQSVLDYLSEQSGKPAWECQKLAARFGLSESQLGMMATALSGGYQMRVKLIKLLLGDPNLLLLDEPVNFLDLPTLLLLEEFLREYQGAFLMTSHDRELMQRTCTSTWEIERGALTLFPEPIEQYLDFKEEQRQFQLRTNKKLKREIAHTQKFVDRFRYKASLATRAQSKLKHISKLRAQLQDLPGALKTAAFRIDCPPVPNGPALRLEELSIGYGDKIVATNLEMDVPRGAKVAIVGENGQGKSTLLKTIAGHIAPNDGVMRWFKHADIGFFSQHNESTLNPEATVLQTLSAASAPGTSNERLLATAGAFLFHDDDLEKPCRVLSGGEQARLRLACLILQQHNVLLLDEPTNHLDAETVDVLAGALQQYPGTLFVVSHARTFLNALVDRIYEIEDGRLRLYPGTYEEYVDELKARTRLYQDEPTPTESVSEKKEAAREAHRARKELQKLEKQMKELESEKSEILAYYFENPTDYAPEKHARLAEIHDEISRLEQRWLALQENGK